MIAGINKSSLSEAPESNAGDDFHVIWTIKRCLELLNFDDYGLKAIVVEGVETKDQIKIDPYGNKLLGVDVSEYFGGQSFSEANKVVVSQLKYSTRRTETAWRFSDLYKGKKANSYEGSIFHRLTQIYTAFISEFGQEEVNKKLTLKFISNREFSRPQEEALRKVKTYLAGNSPVSGNALRQQFPALVPVFEKFRAASGLSFAGLMNFLKLFDLSDCGASSSYYHEMESVQALSNFGITRTHQFDTLFRKIWEKMLPQAIQGARNIVTVQDVTFWLNTTHERLFPVKSAFEKLEHLVQKKQVSSIIESILNHSNISPICLHGEAGIGKSTTSQLIRSAFPTHSEVVLYDCYGAGSYLNPSDSRHLHREALVQISNEVAKRIGSRLLIPGDHPDYILVREFKSRMAEAVNILRMKNPSAVLVLIADAADNSVTAGENSNTKSFIKDLIKESWPEGFRLVVTCRTHRKQILGLPSTYLDVPILPFDLEETSTHLKGFFPDSSDQQLNDFHDLTNGNPRVQAYVLALKREGVEQVVNYLKPFGKSVEDLFEEKTATAAIQLGGSGEKIIKTFFSFLIALPRPVPLALLSSLADQDEGLLRDFAVDIWHGLVFDSPKGLISFRDEDFENYVRNKYPPTSEIRKQIAQVFFNMADKDDYAAANLGIALFHAGNKEKLIEVVLNEQFLGPIVDPIRKQATFLERAKLAMEASNNFNGSLNFFKLAFLVAEASKTDSALNDLFISNPEWVAAFGEESLLQNILKGAENAAWGGKFYYHLAAIYSRNEEYHDSAKRYLKYAREWADWSRRQSGRDRYSLSISALAYGAEAVLRVHGPEALADWLTRWKPRKAVYMAVKEMISILARTADKKFITLNLKKIDPTLHVKLLLLEKTAYLDEPVYDLDAIGGEVLKFFNNGRSLDDNLWGPVISFCELWFRSSKKHGDDIRSILDRLKKSVSEHVPSFVDEVAFRDNDVALVTELVLRKKALLAAIEGSRLTLEEIYPEELKKESEEDSYNLKEQKRRYRAEFDRFYRHAVPIFQLKADLICEGYTDRLALKIEEICKSLKNDYEFQFYDPYRAGDRLRFLARMMAKTLDFLPHKDGLPELIAESFQERNQNNIQLRINVCESLSHLKTYFSSISKLLNESHIILQSSHMPAKELVDYYIKISRIANYIDKRSGGFYFDQAIAAAKEVDVEAQEQIKAISNLSNQGILNHNAKLAYEYGRFVEYCKIRLDGYDHFPIVPALKGIMNLDPASGFSTICRWSHRNVIDLVEEIQPILESSLDTGFLLPQTVASLLPLNRHYWHSYANLVIKIIKFFDESGNSIQKSHFLENVLSDIKIHCPRHNRRTVSKEILNEIRSGRFLTKAVLNDFRWYVHFLDHLEEPRVKGGTEIYNTADNKLIEVDLSGIDITSEESLSAAIATIAKDEQNYPSYQVDALLDAAGHQCSIQNHIPHLTALISIAPEHLSYHSFETALTWRLREWGSDPSVRKWALDNFKKILLNWFSILSDHNYIDFNRIKNLGYLLFVDDSLLKDAIKELLPDHLESLSASAIYQTIGFLSPQITPEENEDLLTWVLARSNLKIKDEFGDGAWKSELLPNGNSYEVVAQTLRYVIGHPDVRIRWRGLHCLRRIVNYGETEILKLLLEQQDIKGCFPFQHKSFPFFWISAKLYLWVCVYRLSQECPARIVTFRDHFIKELANQSLPHALVLYLAKHTCQNLIEHSPSSFTKEEKKLVERALQSPYEPAPIDRKAKHGRRKSESDLRFSFDSMDTLPYWYRRLGDCFNLSSIDVAILAEKYIVEDWGFDEEAIKKDHVKVPEREYWLASNDHGSLPTIEKLRRYCEYHGMFCAGLELLQTCPTTDRDPSDWRSWHNWIARKGLTLENWWLSDLRDPVPQEKKFWISEFSRYDETWRKTIEDDLYASVVGLIDAKKRAALVLYGGYTRYFGENYESVSIRSAMVSPDTADSLLHALQSAEEDHDYRIPLEDDELEINEGPFKMTGWLRLVSPAGGELDEKDPHYNDVDKTYVKFGREVEKFFSVRYEHYDKIGLINNSLVSRTQNWSEVSERRGYDELQTQGQIFRVHVDFLLDFLSKQGMDLIVECVIDRRLKDRTTDYRGYERSNSAKLFLIDSNGNVKTTGRRSYCLG